MTTKAKKKTESTEFEKLQAIGRCAYGAIAEMVAKLDAENDDGDPDDDARDKAREAINEDPLSVRVRSGWHNVGESDDGPEEFEILLSTGGPATRIVGELSIHGEPTRARLEAQDWFTPWTEYRSTSDEDQILLTYAQQFVYRVD